MIHHVYYYENGTLLLKPEYHEVDGWPPGEAKTYTPLLIDSVARGGWFYGLFDGAKLIGAAILDGRFIGRKQDQFQLTFFHVSQAYRQRGLGKRLFTLAQAEARERGAKRLYISATPSENTMDFYRGLGCVVTQEVDGKLFALEPKDIHLECEV